MLNVTIIGALTSHHAHASNCGAHTASNDCTFNTPCTDGNDLTRQ
jgi:hypothetical protein